MAHMIDGDYGKQLVVPISTVNTALRPIAVAAIAAGNSIVSYLRHIPPDISIDGGAAIGAIASMPEAKALVNKILPLPKPVAQVNSFLNKVVEKYPILRLPEIIIKTGVGATIAPHLLGLASMQWSDVVDAWERKDVVALGILAAEAGLALDLGARVATKVAPLVKKAYVATEPMRERAKMYAGWTRDVLTKRTDFEEKQLAQNARVREEEAAELKKNANDPMRNIPKQ